MLIQTFGFNATGKATGRLLSPGLQFGGGSIGAVFGTYPNQYGVIVANIELSASVSWGNDFNVTTTSNLFGGTTNTAAILAQDPNAIPAKYCNEYSASMNGITYSDWALPTTSDLTECRKNNTLLAVPFNVIDGASGPSLYWTSYTTNFNTAYITEFNESSGYYPETTGFRCCGPSSPGPGVNYRPVRYFDFR
jgi:hypothetical protein